MMVTVDIGVFAHNEAEGIGRMVNRLAAQDILRVKDMEVRVLVLANGCRDATVAIAQAAARNGIYVVDLAEGGKSRTWNRFVQTISRPEADILVFCDADIEFCDTGALQRLVRGLQARPELWVLNSRPVKDIVARPEGLSLQDRLIAASGGGLDDWKTAICGQLYAMPTDKARRFRLPVGLPVEDGFLRAMVLTDALTQVENFSRIDGSDSVSHIYASERKILSLLRHQTRIVVGSAINLACFGFLRTLPVTERHQELRRAMVNDRWLPEVIRRELPRVPYGYVPPHFLVKRLAKLLSNRKDRLNPKRIVISLLGSCFDVIVYLRAQVAMAGGAGAGYW
jgi:glycosyltransferase involved in cell wall biosynthesis